MRPIAFCVALEGLAALSCMATVPSTEALPPLGEEALLRSPRGDSPLTAEFQVEDGIARCHLEWAESCRRVLLVRDREQDIEHTKPSYPAATLAGIGAVGAGAGGVALLNNLDDFSTDDICHVDDEGNRSCSSPRDDAAVGSIILISTAIALAATSIVTATTKPTTTLGDVHVGEPRESRLLAENTACGDGPVAGIGLSLRLADERVAASVSDARGDVAFRVPDWVTGPLTLVVDSVPPKTTTIRPGLAVGTVRIDPVPKTVPW